MRCVVDTNVLVSGVILSSSVPRQAVSKALRTDVVLFSEDTMNELAEVLLRSKFDQYVSREERTRFLAELGAVAEFVPIIQVVCECRDPKDDKFLQVALNGRADCIITGDADLLGMNPWRGIAVVAAADYLRR
ncbi:MAG TPA: putative toxin-antitoxin system toxin component, PIN family [Candidatus Sulfotelmatobacter sp.]|nr:putative toxin-antitoxin system toxin component, PIN family [Candidatus Sulfotelmatobacter sp.]